MLKVSFKIIRIGRDGQKYGETPEIKSRSFMKAFVSFLLCLFQATTDVSVPKDITGAAVTYDASTYLLDAHALGTITSQSIIAGSGDTTLTVDDYSLETLIAHGTGAGQLQYPTGSFSGLLVDGDDIYFNMTRTLTNGSGGSVTIKEIGVAANSMCVTLTQKNVLIIRDILTTPEVVPDGESRTIQYTVKVTI